MKIRSSIKPTLKKSLLLRGTALATLGLSLLLFVNNWGFLLFAVSLTLVTVGLLPYRLLTRLETHPHEISVDQNLTFSYCGKPTFSIPIVSIDRFAYREDPHPYGIAVWLKKPLPEKVIVYDQKNLKKCRPEKDYDLFLPHFSKRGFEELVKALPAQYHAF